MASARVTALQAALSEKANPVAAEEEVARQAAATQQVAVTQQTAILKRFLELLRTQRDRFREYLNALDKQQTVIEKGDAEALLSQIELEEQLVADIFAIQKAIGPMEEMYRATTAQPEPPAPLAAPTLVGKFPAEGETEVADLISALEELRREAAIRSARNKDLLSRRMAEIQGEIKGLRGNPYAARPSIYSGTGPSMIDLQG